MSDMCQIIVPKSDQINADDPALNGGRTMTITVTGVRVSGGQEQPVSIEFAGSSKVFRPCKSMCRVLVKAWGDDSKKYVGKSMTLYCDPDVKFGPLKVGGIRISHMSHIDGDMVMALQEKKGLKKAFKVRQLTNAPAASADKAADGVRTLIARINSVDEGNLANITDDPVVVKQRAWLSANRWCGMRSRGASRPRRSCSEDCHRPLPHPAEARLRCRRPAICAGSLVSHRRWCLVYR
jgi:hypothetical protein